MHYEALKIEHQSSVCFIRVFPVELAILEHNYLLSSKYVATLKACFQEYTVSSVTEQ